VEEDGRTRIRDRFVVSTPLSGRVLRSTLKAGDAVTAGATVATVVPSLPPLIEARTRRELEERVGAAEATAQEAVARLERAAAQEEQARKDVDRVRALVERGVATSQQREREELALRIAERDRQASELRRHASEHELNQAHALLRRYDQTDSMERWDVTAPVAGRILRVLQESEAAIQAGAPLLEIGNPGDLEVIVDVLTTDAVEIRPGAPVLIDRWGGPAPLEGKVRIVEPAAFTKVSALGVEEQRVWVIIDITSPRESWATLGDAFRVDVRITVEETPAATLLPSSALFRRGEEWATFVVGDGVAREVPVTLARRAGQLASVTGGVKEGDRVVIFPPSTLEHGARVVER
jgi:HlyD family secretion protein